MVALTVPERMPVTAEPDRSAAPRVLMVDVGGTHIKMMVDGADVRKLKSKHAMTAAAMAKNVLEETADWKFDVVTIGFPGLVRSGAIIREPLNLSEGWVGFDFSAAFGRPVRLINDAAMQALAHYQEGRMLFVGFGTSIGATLVADDVLIPVEVGLLRLASGERFMDRLTKVAFKQDRSAWQQAVTEGVAMLRDVFWPDQTVLGGGNTKFLDPLPPGCIAARNEDGYLGAQRLWEGVDLLASENGTTWRITHPSGQSGPVPPQS